MKLFNLFVTVLAFVAFDTAAQNVSPTLHVVDNNRDYYVNRGIPGQTEDSQGINYLLLHPIYSGTAVADSYVMGKISAVRGSSVSLNRKWSVEVNTASAYLTNRGSMISYNEPARLVSLTYNENSYLALQIANNSTLYSFSFTGYAQNESFQLVRDENVANVQLFTTTDPVSMQGSLGINTTSPAAPLHVHSQTGLGIAKFTYEDVPVANAFLNIVNGTSVAGSYFPCILGRSYTPGKPLGIGIIGEGDDITGGGNLGFGAVVLDGRSKTGALVSSNVLAVNNYGTNLLLVKADGSVGIGTTNTHGHKLAVNGSGLFTKVKVKASGAWPDYVFHPDYQLPSLNEVEQYIQNHQHLQGIPSAHEVQKEGHDLGEMDKKLLQKVEELMLYTIAQQKQIDALTESNRQMRKELQELKASRR